jgi:hypothetical protein
VNRTVVDLSLSFLVTVSFYSLDEFRVVADEQRMNLQQTANRYRLGIAFRRISTDFRWNKGHDVQMFVAPERARLPH